MANFDGMYQSLLKGRARQLLPLINESLEEGIGAEDILNRSLLPAMSEVGDKFKNNEYFMPEVMRCAQSFNQALDILRPLMVEGGLGASGTAVIGTVFGDKHDIGKNLVSIMLQGAGFKVIDLGSEVSPEQFCDAVVENNAQILAMSALLTTTMKYQKETIELLIKKGLRDKVKVMVGGAPVTQEFADTIGADAYSSDAGSAAQAALKLAAGQ